MFLLGKGDVIMYTVARKFYIKQFALRFCTTRISHKCHNRHVDSIIKCIFSSFPVLLYIAIAGENNRNGDDNDDDDDDDDDDCDGVYWIIKMIMIKI